MYPFGVSGPLTGSVFGALAVQMIQHAEDLLTRDSDPLPSGLEESQHAQDLLMRDSDQLPSKLEEIL